MIGSLYIRDVRWCFMKRGQVAIFIIMAVLIAAVVGFFFVLRSDTSNSPVSGDGERVYSFVKDCADEVYLDVIYSVGTRGGYFDSPSESISFGIPLYRIGEKVSVPVVGKIEEEIAKGFNEALMDCVGDFSLFSDLDVSPREAASIVEISDNEIILDVVYPMTVKKGEASDLLERFGEIRVPLRMGLMHKIAVGIAESEDPASICLTCLAKIADENNFKIDIVDYDVGELFMIISYEEEEGRIFEFSFAMKE